jgi:hypothetical protein
MIVDIIGSPNALVEKSKTKPPDQKQIPTRWIQRHRFGHHPLEFLHALFLV